MLLICGDFENSVKIYIQENKTLAPGNFSKILNVLHLRQRVYYECTESNYFRRKRMQTA